MASPLEGPGRPCAICQSPFEPGDPTFPCPACGSPYHPECWSENGGCAVYGCSKVPATEARSGLEIPAAHWGQESRSCPSCGTTIMAAAVRCRSCGAAVDPAGPQDPREFRRRQALTRRQPTLRRVSGLVFALCLLPCTAPLAAVPGLFWYSARRDDLRSLPGIYPVLVRIGLVVAFGQMIWLAVAVLLYGIFRAR
jgi:hypothetical protein